LEGPALQPTKKIKLFDGQSFSGWTFISKDTNELAASIWSVTNGIIACAGKPNGYARTLQTYRDYQLHAEWRFPAGPGNSGIFLHIIGEHQVWPNCLEAQLLSGRAGEIRCNGGSRVQELTLATSLPCRTGSPVQKSLSANGITATSSVFERKTRFFAQSS
jgi:hypothetical protein